jgi:hypothetical protein
LFRSFRHANQGTSKGRHDYELEVPWSVLEIEPPRLGAEVPLALIAGFPDKAARCNLFQLVTPETFRYAEPATYVRGLLAEWGGWRERSTSNVQRSTPNVQVREGSQPKVDWQELKVER